MSTCSENLSMHLTKKSNEAISNWAGNVTYGTNNIYYPKTVEDLQSIVRQFNKLKVLGSRHCFNTIADSKHYLVSLSEMEKVMEVNETDRTITVSAGTTYGELCPYIQEHGLALHNLASLPHISIAGSVATATHGSGIRNGNLATSVVAIEVLTATGDIIQVSEKNDTPFFYGMVVGLGALGIVTRLSLQLQPAFTIQQFVFEDLPIVQLYNHFEEIISSAYSVSLFTNWQNEVINSVWIKAMSDEVAQFENTKTWFGARAATKKIHPLPDTDAANCTEQMGLVGPWFERLPHFKWGFTPSKGEELQSEYFLKMEYAVPALQAVSTLAAQLAPHLFISEIRTIAADEFWMSPCYKQQSVAIHFTWKPNQAEVMTLLPKIEAVLEAFAPRPHWGKLFTMPQPVLAGRFARMHEFVELMKAHDPMGKFRNEFLEEYVLR